MNTLIIFAKNLIAGKVKTRIAASTSSEFALMCYQKLLEYTLRAALAVDAKRLLYFSEFIPVNEVGDGGFHYHLQDGLDLGQRMKNALNHSFQNGASKTVLIGSDCLMLTPSLISEAYQHLEKVDIVLGPADDGGYYLIGMKRLHKKLFEDKAWSHSHVLEDALKVIEDEGLSFSLLPVLKDVDHYEDLPYDFCNSSHTQ